MSACKLQSYPSFQPTYPFMNHKLTAKKRRRPEDPEVKEVNEQPRQNPNNNQVE
jgi:hypothetical protein